MYQFNDNNISLNIIAADWGLNNDEVCVMLQRPWRLTIASWRPCLSVTRCGQRPCMWTSAWPWTSLSWKQVSSTSPVTVKTRAVLTCANLSKSMSHPNLSAAASSFHTFIKLTKKYRKFNIKSTSLNLIVLCDIILKYSFFIFSDYATPLVSHFLWKFCPIALKPSTITSLGWPHTDVVFFWKQK